MRVVQSRIYLFAQLVIVAIGAGLSPRTQAESLWQAAGLDRPQGRSMVMTQRGIVATSQALASQAGAQILARGGSAADAAIAANAVLGTVEPMMDGIGGDLFALEWDAKNGKLSGLNSSGWAPQKLTRELLNQKGISRMPAKGIHSVTVPGCVQGWKALHERFGRLPWPELFQAAIYYARNGFPVTEIVAAYWNDGKASLTNNAEAGRIFLPNGAARGRTDLPQPRLRPSLGICG
jgi:gamma-glutamyltranspeptidase/glutathione hydrolase